MNYIKTIGQSNYTKGNDIYADNDNYYIKAPKSEAYLIIDKDDRTLKYIEQCVSQYGNIQQVNKSHSFEMSKSVNGNKVRAYVSHLLIAYYENREYRGNESVGFRDNNNLNCKRDNLINRRNRSRAESRSVKITHDNEYIYIKVKKNGLVFITDYEQELFNLLISKRISWSYNNSKGYKGGKDYSRLTAEVFHNGKKCRGIYTSLPRLVYGYYNYDIKRSNLASAIRKMDKDLKNKELIVEHLIADETNCTKANLSLTDSITNTNKRAIDRKIIPPYYLVMAYKGGKYKAVLCFSCNATFVYGIKTCDSLCELVKEVFGVLECSLLPEYKSVLKWRTEANIRKYNLPYAYKLQKVLYDEFDNPLVDIHIGEYINVFYGNIEKEVMAEINQQNKTITDEA